MSYLRGRDFLSASRSAGTLSHYIDDLAAFPHVMGSSTDWGDENHHQDYETYVNGLTDSYSAAFDTNLVFDGSLEELSAYDAALRVAHDTTFDGGGREHTALWMDDNYDWSNAAFSERVGSSLNAAANAIADVLHTLWVESGRQPEDFTSWFAHNAYVIVIVVAVVILVTQIIYRPRKRRRSKKRQRRKQPVS